MSKTAYTCEGDFQMGRIRQHFNIEVVAENEEAAHGAVFAELGSRHGVPRRQIEITSVAAMKADDAGAITQKRLE